MTQDERNRMRQIGKQAYVREELVRLGYWPPSPEVAEQAKEAEIQLNALYKQLVDLQNDLTAVEAEIANIGDIPSLIAEIRRKRIERVRTERTRRREERKAERTARQEADRTWRKTALPFLGRGVSGGLVYAESDREKLQHLGLPYLQTATDIAQAIGITEKELAWLAYHRAATGVDHYTRFTIPKKKGGVRVISSPKRRLRVAQAWILTTIFDALPVHDAALAFRPGRSVVDNARTHANKAVVVKVDLKDFFPSIHWKRVKDLFQSFGYNEGVATILALVSTETPRIAVLLDGQRKFAAVGERAVPQGACTSPALTNLICQRLDGRLVAAAASYGFVYTRYADDLTFSHTDEDARIGGLLALVRQIIGSERFTVKEEKTQILRAHDRQAVTGLVVNGLDNPRVSREDLRRFRAFLHGCATRGLDAMTEQIGKDALAYASGYLSYLHMARPDIAAKIAARNPWLHRWRKG